MNVQMVRFTVKTEFVSQFESSVDKIMHAIHKLDPTGVRYSIYRSGANQSFIGLLEIEDGIGNPLLALPEGQAFMAGIEHWLETPPAREPLTILGNFNSFSKDGLSK